MSGSVGNNPYRASGVVAEVLLLEEQEQSIGKQIQLSTATFTASADAEGYFCNTYIRWWNYSYIYPQQEVLELPVECI